jgi:hypothetical protein
MDYMERSSATAPAPITPPGALGFDAGLNPAELQACVDFYLEEFRRGKSDPAQWGEEALLFEHMVVQIFTDGLKAASQCLSRRHELRPDATCQAKMGAQ